MRRRILLAVLALASMAGLVGSMTSMPAVWVPLMSSSVAADGGAYVIYTGHSHGAQDGYVVDGDAKGRFYVYAPGGLEQSDIASFQERGRPVKVRGNPGWLSDGPVTEEVLWMYAPGAWAKVSSDHSDVMPLAGDLVIGQPVPLALPFRPNWLPAGWTVTDWGYTETPAGGRAWSLGIESPDHTISGAIFEGTPDMMTVRSQGLTAGPCQVWVQIYQHSGIARKIAAHLDIARCDRPFTWYGTADLPGADSIAVEPMSFFVQPD